MENNIYFTKQNYILIAAGVIISVIGYILMAGGNDPDPSKYSEDIFSDRRITLAPFVVMLGYVVVLIGIMKKFKPDVLESEIQAPVKKSTKKK